MKKSIDELTIKYQSGIKFIKEELDDLVHLQYDDPMRLEKATAIATKMRVLIFDNGNNKSLLNQLNIKDCLLFQSKCIDHTDIASNLLFSSLLVSLQVRGDGKLFCVPEIPVFHHKLSCTFDVWWNEIVIDTKGEESAIVSRGDVIRTLSDKEGGAHEDPNHSKEYKQVNYHNGFLVTDQAGNQRTLENNFYVETLVVIAYEFLDAINVYDKYIRISKTQFENTYYTIIQVSYMKNNKNYYRYYPNSNRNINLNIIMAYDHYRDANYSVVNLTGHCFMNKENQMIRFLVIDNRKSQPIMYLNANQGLESRAVILKKESGFVLIRSDDDIFSNCETHDISYYEVMVSHNEYKSPVYYLFKEAYDNS